MIKSYYIIGSNEKMPDNRGIVYCDGSEENEVLRETDLELSHWNNNRTPEEYAGDTSTEICMNFVEKNIDKDVPFDLVVNNHLDVDGLLSVFTILHSDIALRYRSTIIQAAKIGDFWSYGSEQAFLLFQAITILFNEEKTKQKDIQEIYRKCIDETIHILENDNSRIEGAEAAFKIIGEEELRLKSGEIIRQLINDRLVHYHITGEDIKKNIAIPSFNGIIKDDITVHPQFRNKLDSERVHLISIEGIQGNYYQLFYPGYIWAITSSLWRPPFHEIKNRTFDGFDPRIDPILDQLTSMDNGEGKWTRRDKSMLGLITTYSNAMGEQIESTISPDKIIQFFGAIFA